MGPWMIPLATTALGIIMGQQQKKEDARVRKNQALVNMYAPLFNQQVKAMEPIQNRVTPAAVSGAIRGVEMMQDPIWGDLFKDDTNLVMPQGTGNKYGLGLDLPSKSMLDDAAYAPSLAGTGGPGMGLGLSSPMSVASSANVFNKDPYKLGIGYQEPVPETAKYFQPYAH